MLRAIARWVIRCQNGRGICLGLMAPISLHRHGVGQPATAKSDPDVWADVRLTVEHPTITHKGLRSNAMFCKGWMSNDSDRNARREHVNGEETQD